MSNRRELETRKASWAKNLARFLAEKNVSPNLVSVMSILFAALAAYGMLMSLDSSGYWLLAAAGIQLRLLCNMMDGMIAVEFKRQSPTGDLFNEVPDRIADSLILVSAGYAPVVRPWGPELGWFIALLAISTAYLRLLGGTLGCPQFFIGPMAKQHRMFAMTCIALLSAFEQWQYQSQYALFVGLFVIALGTVATIFRRLSKIAAHLRQR